MELRKRIRLLSNHEHCPRISVYEWGSYDPKTESDEIDEDLEMVKTLFENKIIKWYILVEETIDLMTAQLSTKMLESASHEELPTIEFNVKAKSEGPPTLVFKFPEIEW